MPSSITQSQLLPILAAVVAFLFAALLLLYIYRLLFGRRIKAPGPRNRPRRLDIVDTFELDGDRQLVIVRRDNVEHLLLLGGPNDLLVEGSITRVESREARPREAGAPSGWPLAPPPILPPIGETNGSRRPVEPGPPPPPPPGLAPLPSDMFAPPPPPPPKPAIPPLAGPAPEPAPPQTPAPRPAPSRFTPPPPRPGFTPTPRPPRPAPPPFLSRAQRPAQPQAGAEPPAAAPPPAPASASPTPEPPAAPQPSPPAPSPPPPPPAPPPAAPEPAPGAAPPPPAAAPTPPAQEPPQPAPKPAEAADPLDLEAEMARLLGRPEPKQ